MKHKAKIKKTLLKKIKITKTGKVLRSHQFRSGHLRSNRSKQALRRHRVPIVVDKTIEKTVKRLLGRA